MMRAVNFPTSLTSVSAVGVWPSPAMKLTGKGVAESIRPEGRRGTLS